MDKTEQLLDGLAGKTVVEVLSRRTAGNDIAVMAIVFEDGTELRIRATGAGEPHLGLRSTKTDN